MNKAQEPGRHIISKGRFAVNISRQVVLALFGLSISGLGIVALFYGILGIQLLIAHTRNLAEIFMVTVVSVMLLSAILIVFPLMLIHFGVTAIKQSNQMNIGIPHTHANTADLPAPDTLVRASQEPMQTQEDLLLRASVETQERHEEQLLRSAMVEQA